jgi:hypothetical protein
LSTLAQQAALAANPGFLARIQSAIVKAATALLAAPEDKGHPLTFKRVTDLATSVMTETDPWLARFGRACAVTSAVADADMSLYGIAGTTAGPPAVITTTAPHGMGNGAVVSIAGAADAILNGTWAILATGATTFTIPVAGTEIGAAGGTVTLQPTDTGINTAVASVWNDIAGVVPGMV